MTHSKISYRAYFLGSAATLSLALPLVSHGQESRVLEEIVVTSQHRAQSMQDVPIAITALSGALMESANLDLVIDLPRLTPGMEFNRYVQFVSPFLRGVGTRYANPGLESTVGIYLDDLYSARTGASAMDFVDIERVEVLKGPQGTLYGRNTSGGAVRVVTRDPTDQFEGMAAITYGRYDRLRLDGVLNVPISDTLSSRFAVTSNRMDGYVKTTVPGVENMHERDTIQASSKILWEPTDRISVLYAGTYGEKDDSDAQSFINIDNGLGQVGVIQGGTPSADFYTNTTDLHANDGSNVKMRIWSHSLKVNVAFDLFDFTSITGYRDYKNSGMADLDATDISWQHADTPLESTESFSQEFQLTSNSDGNLSWVSGLYYYKEESENLFAIFGNSMNAALGLPFQDSIIDPTGNVGLYTESEVDVEALAPYAQFTYTFNPQVALTVGGRYTWEEKTMPHHIGGFYSFTKPGPTPLSVLVNEPKDKLKFEEFTPKVTLEYRPNENMMLYASWSQGFKSGGFNLPVPTGRADRLDSETLDAYEIGWKTEFERIRWNGAAFYYDYQDIQVGRSNPEGGGAIVQNAASAEIYGIETDITFAVTDALEVAMGGSWLHTEFEDFIGDGIIPRTETPACIEAGGTGLPCAGYLVVPGQDFSGNELPLAPEFSGYVRGQYYQPLADDLGSLTFDVLFSFTGDFYWGSDPAYLDEPEKKLLSAGVGWKSVDERYSVRLFGDNLLNEKYRVNVVRNANGGYYTPGDPRTWGVRIGINF